MYIDLGRGCDGGWGQRRSRWGRWLLDDDVAAGLVGEKKHTASEGCACRG